MPLASHSVGLVGGILIAPFVPALFAFQPLVSIEDPTVAAAPTIHDVGMRGQHEASLGLIGLVAHCVIAPLRLMNGSGPRPI